MNQRRIKNYDNFIEQMERQSPPQLLVAGSRRLPDPRIMAVPGNRADFRYDVLYYAGDDQARKCYIERLLVAKNEFWRPRTAEEHAVVDRGVGTLVLTVETRVELLQAALPDTQVAFCDRRTGAIITEEALAEARANALQAGSVIIPVNGTPVAPQAVAA